MVAGAVVMCMPQSSCALTRPSPHGGGAGPRAGPRSPTRSTADAAGVSPAPAPLSAGPAANAVPYTDRLSTAPSTSAPKPGAGQNTDHQRANSAARPFFTRRLMECCDYPTRRTSHSKFSDSPGVSSSYSGVTSNDRPAGSPRSASIRVAVLSTSSASPATSSVPLPSTSIQL